MPTFQQAPRFKRDFDGLSPEQKLRFKDGVRKFIEDLKRGDGFRPGLRVRSVAGTDGIFEMTWEGDGRATFEYGREIRPGEPHVIWRRVGTHGIFGRP